MYMDNDLTLGIDPEELAAAAAAEADTTPEINPDIPVISYFGRASETPEYTSDPQKQKRRVIGFRYVIIGTVAHGYQFIPLRIAAGNHYHRNIRPGSQLTKNVLPVLKRKVDIQQHHIGSRCNYILYGIIEGGNGLGIISGGTEKDYYLISYIFLILDHNDFLHLFFTCLLNILILLSSVAYDILACNIIY